MVLISMNQIIFTAVLEVCYGLHIVQKYHRAYELTLKMGSEQEWDQSFSLAPIWRELLPFAGCQFPHFEN